MRAPTIFYGFKMIYNFLVFNIFILACVFINLSLKKNLNEEIFIHFVFKFCYHS